MTIVGSKKMLVYDDISENKITIYDKGIDRVAKLGENMDFDSPTYVEFSHRSGDVLMPKINWQEPLKVEIAHFINCIVNGLECETGIEHTKNVIDILSRSTNNRDDK